MVVVLGGITLLVLVLFAVAIDANLDPIAGQLDDFVGQRLISEAVHGDIHRESRMFQAVEINVLQVFWRRKVIFRDNRCGLGIVNPAAEMKLVAEMEQHGQSDYHQNDWKPTTKTTHPEVEIIHQAIYLLSRPKRNPPTRACQGAQPGHLHEQW